MLELLGLMALILIVGALAAGLLKLLFCLLVLPIKLGFWMLKGVVALVFIVPLAIISLCVASTVLPVVAFAIALPITLVAGGVVLLVKVFA